MRLTTPDSEKFSKTVSELQVNRHKLAKMTTQVNVAKTFNYALAQRVRLGEQPVGEAAMAKNFSGQVAIDVCYEAVQILAAWGICAKPELRDSAEMRAFTHWRRHLGSHE